MMMMLRAVVLALSLVGPVVAFPANEGDTQIVESTVREVRAVAPEQLGDLVDADTDKAFLHSYGNLDGDKDEQGFHRSVEDEGAKGYKHFDSFHKKDGDKYGFETHSAYGKAKHENNAAGGHGGHYAEAEEEGRYENDKDGAHSEALSEEQPEDAEESKHTYSVVEDVDESSDGGHYEAAEEEDEDGGHYDSGAEEADDGDADDGHYYEGHYTEAEDDGGDGSAGHYTEGSSGYDSGEPEHYTAIDDYDD